MENLVSDIKQMTRALIDKNRSLEQSLVMKEAEIQALKEQVESGQEEVANLANQNNVLKMAGSLKGEEVDTTMTKRRINELVREIDKCIALLNK